MNPSENTLQTLQQAGIHFYCRVFYFDVGLLWLYLVMPIYKSNMP